MSNHINPMLDDIKNLLNLDETELFAMAADDVSGKQTERQVARLARSYRNRNRATIPVRKNAFAETKLAIRVLNPDSDSPISEFYDGQITAITAIVYDKVNNEVEIIPMGTYYYDANAGMHKPATRNVVTKVWGVSKKYYRNRHDRNYMADIAKGNALIAKAIRKYFTLDNDDIRWNPYFDGQNSDDSDATTDMERMIAQSLQVDSE